MFESESDQRLVNLLSAFSLAMGTSHWVCVIMCATEPNKRSEMRLEDFTALTIQEKSSWQLEGKSVPRNLFRLYLRLVWERKGFSTLKGSPARSLKESQDKENGYLSFSPQNLLHIQAVEALTQRQNCTGSILVMSSCTPGCFSASLTGCKCPFSCFLFSDQPVFLGHMNSVF